MKKYILSQNKIVVSILLILYYQQKNFLIHPLLFYYILKRDMLDWYYPLTIHRYENLIFH